MTSWCRIGKNKVRKSRIITAISIAIMISSCVCMTSCGTDDIDISGYQDETVTISGVVDKDIRLTIKDLKELECITRSAESTSDKIGKVKATGPTLDTVLKSFGSAQTDFDSIRIYASDGYDIKLNSDFLSKNAEIIIAFGIDGKPLDAENAPLRLIIPGSDSAYWIRMIDRIECESQGSDK